MKLLPPSSIHLLSSGQVVTSVVSIVKELVENAVDASATKIDVKLEKFGFDKIEVQDNGVGVPSGEASFMALPHYTSKIMTFSDVEALTTYGFRGEALSSIAAVTDLTIVTKTAEEGTGNFYKFSHSGILESSKPVATCTGTIVVVTNLFKTVPVRRQICKNERVQKRDLKQIEELLMHFGIAWPTIRFSLYHNRCLIWSKTSVPDIDSALSQVCGHSWTNCMQKVQIQDALKKISIEAFIPKAAQFATSTEKSRSFVLINKRPVVMKEIEKTLKNAFLQVPSLKEQSNMLGYCISLTVQPSDVDVNLEPNKRKVMLQDKEKILALLSEVLDNTYNNNKVQDGLEEQTDACCNSLGDNTRLKAQNNVLCSVKTSDKCDVSKEIKSKDNRTKKHEIVTDNEQSYISTNLFVDEDEFFNAVCNSECSSFDLSDSSVQQGLSAEAKTTTVQKVVNKAETPINSSKTVQLATHSVNNVPDNRKEYVEETDQSRCKDDYVEMYNLVSNPQKEVSYPVDAGRSGSTHVVGFEKEVIAELEADATIQTVNELNSEKQIDNTAWSKGTIKDAADCVIQPVQLLNPLLKRRLSPTEDNTDKSNNVNPKKKKCADISKSQPTLYTLAQGHPVKQQFSAYTLFARDVRLAVMNENPSADFSQISKIIYDKWQNLSKEERNEFELKAGSSKVRQTSVKQKLAKLQTISKTSLVNDSKRCPGSAKFASKTAVPVKVVTVDFALNKFLGRTAEKSTSNLDPKHQSAWQSIGPLAKGCWLFCEDGQLGLYNHLRAREVQLFFNMMVNHKIPTKLLEFPLVLTESLVGGARHWETLTNLSSNPGFPPCHLYIDDARLLSNGIKIKKWMDETTMSWQVEIVGLADCMPFFGINDLKDVLRKLSSNQLLTLEESRPLKVVNYFKEEVVRMVRQLPLKISKDDLEDLYDKMKMLPLPRRTSCLHGHTICIPIFKLEADKLAV